MQIKRYFDVDAYNFYQLILRVEELELTKDQKNLAILLQRELFGADDIILITNDTKR